METAVFAVTNRGLEEISAAELRRLPGVTVRQVHYRRVEALCSGSLAPLLGLRTVDDLFLQLARWQEIPPQRAGLEVLAQYSRELPLLPALEQVASVRRVHARPAFSVTANFVGKRKYTMDEIKAAVGSAIAARSGWMYTTEDASEINIRVFIEHDQASVGMRLADTALHRRVYKQEHVSGSLKPPVAAAMLALAGVIPQVGNPMVCDPFCGAGTILIEAALYGARAAGGDLAPEALLAARRNAQLARVDLPLLRWDARRLPLPDHFCPVVVTNPPWGQQVQVDAQLAAFYHVFGTELARVLQPGGQLVLLTSLPDLVQVPGWRVTGSTEISLFGLNPVILHMAAV